MYPGNVNPPCDILKFDVDGRENKMKFYYFGNRQPIGSSSKTRMKWKFPKKCALWKSSCLAQIFLVSECAKICMKTRIFEENFRKRFHFGRRAFWRWVLRNMTLDSVSIVFSQIEHLIFNLNKKTAKTAVQELQNVSFFFVSRRYGRRFYILRFSAFSSLGPRLRDSLFTVYFGRARLSRR